MDLNTEENLKKGLNRAEGLDLYQIMLRIRLSEKRIAQIYPSDKIQSPIHLSIGQEAISAGICYALGKGDRIYGTYRGHGIFIAKGGDLGKMFSELYGKDTGCARGRGGSMHLVAPEVGLMGCSAIVGSTIPVATGDALASQMQGRPRVVVSFFGDGAVDEGVFFESLNFAALKNLPVIFICENNTLAIHSRVSDRHKQTELFRYGETLGVEGKRIDGNNVGEVYQEVFEKADLIRKGNPPFLIEVMTYRWQEHVGPATDYHEFYRDPIEVKQALQNDPLGIWKIYLKEQFSISEKRFLEIEKNVLQEIDQAVEYAEGSPFPTKESLYADLYE